MTFMKRFFVLREPNVPDPIDHPEIKRMTQRELADLPLPRTPLQVSTSPEYGRPSSQNGDCV